MLDTTKLKRYAVAMKILKKQIKSSQAISNYNNSTPDWQLINDALKNDQTALELLVKKYLPLVYSITNYYAKNSDDAQDITQEVFVKVWKNLKKFNPEKNFYNWIFEIAKNTSLDWLKKKKAIPFSNFEDKTGQNYLADTIADQTPDPYELAQESNSKETLHLAIDQLSFPYQEVVKMHNEKEMTFQEIANLTNQPLNTVKSRHRRALNLLRKILTSNH